MTTLNCVPKAPRRQPDAPTSPFSERSFEEYVCSHGFGDPLPEAIGLGRLLHAEGDDYATIGHEIVARGLVEGLAPTVQHVPVLEERGHDD